MHYRHVTLFFLQLSCLFCIFSPLLITSSLYIGAMQVGRQVFPTNYHTLQTSHIFHQSEFCPYMSGSTHYRATARRCAVGNHTNLPCLRLCAELNPKVHQTRSNGRNATRFQNITRTKGMARGSNCTKPEGIIVYSIIQQERFEATLW